MEKEKSAESTAHILKIRWLLSGTIALSVILPVLAELSGFGIKSIIGNLTSVGVGLVLYSFVGIVCMYHVVKYYHASSNSKYLNYSLRFISVILYESIFCGLILFFGLLVGSWVDFKSDIVDLLVKVLFVNFCVGMLTVMVLLIVVLVVVLWGRFVKRNPSLLH